MRRFIWAALALVPAGCSGSATTSTNTPDPAADPAAGEAFSFENPGGMWMPVQMKAHAETLRKLGVDFEPEALADPTQFPLNAVVSLGGCSASFVSEQGLVITNHHCVTRALQHNSTPDANLLKDGFLAKTMQDEPSAGPTSRIYVTTSFTDVTDKVLPGLEEIKDPTARFKELDKRVKALDETCEAKSEDTRCRIASYFEGAQFFEIEQLEIKDVRLVHAPHAGVGVFGGEVDNWRWPRHTGDYSFLRAYVGPDGKPAPYSENNVPYKPKAHLEIASEALRPGDFAMVAGYPGRTYRLKTADEVATATNYSYPTRIERNEAYIATLEALTKDDTDLAIKAASRLRGLHNSLTNAKGMRDGLGAGGLLDRKRELEAALQTWIDADDARKAEFGDVLGALSKVSTERAKTRVKDDATSELLRSSMLLGVADMIHDTAEKRDKGTLQDASIASMEQALGAMGRSFDPRLDQATMTLALTRVSALPEADRPDAILRAIVGDKATFPLDEAAASKAVAALYAKTKLGNPKVQTSWLRTATAAKLGRSKDPFFKLVAAVDKATADARARQEAYEGTMAALRPRYVAALRAFTEGPLAPDANSTLRVSFGTVRGYAPTPDAEVYEPFTTVSQMLAKHTGKEPFNAPAGAVEAAKVSKESPYVDPALGDVPLDFLTDLDITGGNSGSATLNAKGELIGLAFDGNYESIASDWVFMPDVTRSIHVDVRYILWVMDTVDGAHRLIEEMGATPKVGPKTEAAPSKPAKKPLTSKPASK
jgi:hypothetical protein